MGTRSCCGMPSRSMHGFFFSCNRNGTAFSGRSGCWFMRQTLHACCVQLFSLNRVEASSNFPVRLPPFSPVCLLCGALAYLLFASMCDVPAGMLAKFVYFTN